MTSLKNFIPNYSCNSLTYDFSKPLQFQNLAILSKKWHAFNKLRYLYIFLTTCRKVVLQLNAQV